MTRGIRPENFGTYDKYLAAKEKKDNEQAIWVMGAVATSVALGLTVAGGGFDRDSSSGEATPSPAPVEHVTQEVTTSDRYGLDVDPDGMINVVPDYFQAAPGEDQEGEVDIDPNVEQKPEGQMIYPLDYDPDNPDGN